MPARRVQWGGARRAVWKTMSAIWWPSDAMPGQFMSAGLADSCQHSFQISLSEADSIQAA
jgi:hypothetical protein